MSTPARWDKEEMLIWISVALFGLSFLLITGILGQHDRALMTWLGAFVFVVALVQILVANRVKVLRDTAHQD